jgi:uncharacterized protein (DUF433 family)
MESVMPNRQHGEDRITRNPAVLGGKPIIRGTRISVALISSWIESGVSVDQILEDYPNLDRADIEAAIAFSQSESSPVGVGTS